jgi:hypothetical protein
VKRIGSLVLLVGLAACGGRTPPPQTSTGAPGAYGAVAPQLALEGFFKGVRDGDLQEMALLWGTSKGPAISQLSRDEVEKRIFSIQCFLTHDQFRIVSDSKPDADHMKYRVELTKGKTVQQTDAFAVRGPQDRWYVENVDVQQTKPLWCRKE